MGILMMPPLYEKVIKPQVISEILRPDGSGDENYIRYEVGAAAPNHYLNVDEVVADEDATMVYEDGGALYFDLYELTNLTKPSYLTIQKIVMVGRFKLDLDSDALLALHEPEFAIKTGGSKYRFNACNRLSPPQIPAGVWTDREYELLLNPKTALAWTRDDLNALQLGCGLIRCRYTTLNKEYCTQLYVKVYYSDQP